VNPERLFHWIEGGHEPEWPAALEGVEDRELRLFQVLRLLPKKRAVLRAEDYRKPVVLKCYAKSGSRQAERERRGGLFLRAAGLRTPRVLVEQSFGPNSVRLFEWVEGGTPIHDLGASTASLDTICTVLDALECGYRAGLFQSDLHPSNLLIARGEVWWLDAEGVRGLHRRTLSARVVRQNLACFVAQFPREREPLLVDRLGRHRVAALGGAPGGDGTRSGGAWDRWFKQFEREVAAWRQRRLRAWLKKVQRASTAVHVELRRGARGLCMRESLVAREARAFLQHPEKVFERAERFDDGSTRRRMCWGDREVEIERFEEKPVCALIGRPSKGRVAWIAGHRAVFVGAATGAAAQPEPVALVELRSAPWSERSYYVSAAPRTIG